MKSDERLHSANRGMLAGLVRGAIAAATLLMLTVAGFAQETTSSMRGTVTTPAGTGIEGAQVVITDMRTSSSRSVSTTGTGQFSQSGLRVGGPYEVTISAEGYAPQRVTEIYLNLGDTHTFTVSLSDDTIEEIIVTSAQIGAVQVAIGPSATFTLQDLQDAPAINRDIKDVVKIDARLYVDEGFSDAIHCAGAHPRFNSLTLDGVRLHDQFGLNSNGYPTERAPFSYDAIETVAVELAPFDVQYGGFTACNINAVTKSGTNEFHGTAFYDYTDDSLSGDRLEGDSIDLGSFDETRYGVSIGGPILRDKLFFFAAYEKLDGANIFARGASDGAGAGVAVQGVTTAQLDRIANIARTVYDYDPGAIVSSLPNEDEKFLARFDWDINADHRLAYTFMYNDGFNINESDDDADEFEFSGHYYERGAELKANVLQLLSNWGDNFSTELRVSKNELDNRQINIGEPGFGEVQIRTFANGARTTVYLGMDDSRHANKLDWDSLGFKLTGTYTLGNHIISGGWERDDLDVFNLFVQETEGEFEFEALCNSDNPDGCIDQFEAGTPDDITYENAAPSNVPSDAAALWNYAINTLYLQDEFPIADGAVTIVAGVRYDWYTSSDVPTENPNFIARNGFTNARNFDGESLLQPRLGVNWEVTDRISLRGGVGLYSGGNPNVWLSNNYSNNGITQVERKDNYLSDGTTLLPGDPNGLTSLPNCADGDPKCESGGGRPIHSVPQHLFEQVRDGTANSGVNAIDPNFDIPSAWKVALGGTWQFDAGVMGDDYVLSADLLFSRMNDSAVIRDGTLERIGTAADGRPIYRNIDRSDRGDGMTDFGCYTPEGQLDPTAPTCSQRLFNSDYILDNIKSGSDEQRSFAVSLSKSHDIGIDWTFAYSYTDSEDVTPMTSSVAFSNYALISVSDPNDPGSAVSNYNIPQRFTFRLNFRRAFFGDYLTKFTVFGSHNEGRPFSYVFADGGFTFGDIIDDRHLLYVPTGPNDPNVVFSSDFDSDAFFQFVQDSGLAGFAGGVAPRNEFNNPWWTKWDIRIEQQFPGFNRDHNFAAFLMIENVGNMINDDWGVLREVSFPRRVTVIGVPNSGPPFFNDAGIDDQGRYLFDSFIVPSPPSRVTDASLWEVRFGIKYEF